MRAGPPYSASFRAWDVCWNSSRLFDAPGLGMPRKDLDVGAEAIR